MKHWYYKAGDQQFGPVQRSEIEQKVRSGALPADTLVWNDDMPKWTPWAEVASEGDLPTSDVERALHGKMEQFKLPDVPGRLTPFPEGPGRRIQLEFTGSGMEYFRIWIVNLVLTILTCGIYSAWAKVRHLRYFYGHTRLDGHPFDFTGKPLPILKGQLIFGAAAIVFVLVQAFAPLVAILLGIVLFFSVPWLVLKSRQFRARNTIYRNVRFAFWGTLKDAYSAFVWYPALASFTAGFLIPWVDFKKKSYILGNYAWGNSDADVQGDSTPLYVIAFKAAGITAMLGMLMAGTAALFGFSKLKEIYNIPFDEAAMVGSPFSGKPEFELAKAETTDATAKEDKTVRVNEGFIIYRQGATIPEATSTSTSNRVLENEPQPPPAGSMSEIQDSHGVDENLLDEDDDWDFAEEYDSHAENGDYVQQMVEWMMLYFGAYFVIFMVGWLFYQVRVHNHMVNQLTWSHIGGMESTMRFRDMIWIYLSNAICVLLTIGLLYPWSQIRLARYRASHTFLIVKGDLNAIAETIAPDASAVGDAGADIFDIEIAF